MVLKEVLLYVREIPRTFSDILHHATVSKRFNVIMPTTPLIHHIVQNQNHSIRGVSCEMLNQRVGRMEDL